MFASLIVVFCLFVSAQVAPEGVPQDKPTTEYVGLYCQSQNMFQAIFGVEPVEKLVCVAHTGQVFVFTNFLEHRVVLPLHFLRKELEVYNLQIKDLTIIAHNHFIGGMFSPDDLDYFNTLYNYGFRGAFVLYVQYERKVTNQLWGYEVERIRREVIR